MLSVTPKDGPDGCLQLHASTVALNGRAVAFVGPSGAGKSSSALACIARGARLVADDITWLRLDHDRVIAECPPSISGQIEARGMGILKATPSGPEPLCLIVDLGVLESSRLPDHKVVSLLGQNVALLHKVEGGHFIDAVLHYLSNGRVK